MTTPPPPVGSRAMRVRLLLKPGQKGTKQLLTQYGDRLICVRYRYDALRAAFGEVAVRERVKQACGKWNRDRKVWELRYDQAAALELAGRIVQEPASTSGFQEERAEYLYVDARPLSRWRCSHALMDASVSW